MRRLEEGKAAGEAGTCPGGRVNGLPGLAPLGDGGVGLRRRRRGRAASSTWSSPGCRPASRSSDPGPGVPPAATPSPGRTTSRSSPGSCCAAGAGPAGPRSPGATRSSRCSGARRRSCRCRATASRRGRWRSSGSRRRCWRSRSSTSTPGRSPTPSPCRSSAPESACSALGLTLAPSFPDRSPAPPPAGSPSPPWPSWANDFSRRRPSGFGDVWLLGAIGAWIGRRPLLPVVLLASLQGTVVGLALIVLGRAQPGEPRPSVAPAGDGAADEPGPRFRGCRRRLGAASATPCPFGPFLAAGALEWLWLQGWITTLVPTPQALHVIS